MSGQLLELKNITKRFGETDVLNGITLSIEKGEFITFLGASRLWENHHAENYCRSGAAGQRQRVSGWKRGHRFVTKRKRREYGFSELCVVSTYECGGKCGIWIKN